MKLLRGFLLKPTLNLLGWILRHRNGDSLIIGGPLGWEWQANLDATHHGALAGPVNAHRHSDMANIGTDDHHARLHPTEHQDGGAQEISVAGLSGELADDQKPKAHDASKVTSGTFPVARGGTGLSTLALGGILYVSALNTLSRIAPTAPNQVLRSTAANALQFAALIAADIPNLDASKITTGQLPLARLDPSVCSETEAAGLITTHKGDASAHHARYADAEAKAAAVQAGAITNGVTKAPTHDAVYDVKITADGAIPKSLATAINDFVVASGAGAFIKKTLAEVKTLLNWAADIATHAALSVAGTHGSTTAATANKIVHRDAAGRAKVVAPSAESDVALKSNVTTVNTALTTHGALTTAHGAVSAATASKMVVRDASKRAKFGAPGAAGDALIKGTRHLIAEMPTLTTGKGWKGVAGVPAEADWPAAATVATIPSDNLRNSNDTQKTTTSDAYVKLKEVLLNADLPACRLKFDLYGGTTGADYALAMIFKNDVAIGTQRTGTSSWVTHSQDFTGFVSGDKIQIWGRDYGDSYVCYVKNMRFYYDGCITHFGSDELTEYLGIETDPTISMTNQDP